MSAPPLVPSPLYGLRTWSVVGAHGDERLAAPQRGTAWPDSGGWLRATCTEGAGHAAPAPGCGCGIHAWHPSLRSARTVLGARREVPGVVEAAGTVELHSAGFRAERARPRALLVRPGANSRLVERLAAAHGAEVVPAARTEEVVAWCRERGLGLAPAVVEELLGPDRVAEERRVRRRRARAAGARVAAVLVAIALLLGVGIAVTDHPGERKLSGRTGELTPP